ncbi:hypothetical protein [Sulfurimonas marina]|uniref:Uncharacterized protein n=1 Tax=Sulfurimonas marina TaxID=2590551 RepID=A0A7M1AW78_9BACT|nr:hypothetical protein [Sulfurimonas marina]QOP41721.1 hypothetical protein FJR03_08215 [Sulfurimonas marina]
MQKKRGIALLITVMFVIIITVAVGYTLKQINNSSKYVEKEKSLYQDHIFVDDVISLLNGSEQLKSIVDNKSAEELYVFLAGIESGIPLNNNGTHLIVYITSGRSTFAINFMDRIQEEFLYEYLTRYNVRGEYIELLKDVMKEPKEGIYYNTTIFEEDPTLFRGSIASMKHLKKINRFYKREYQDDSIDAINFTNLFNFSTDRNTTTERNVTIDLNYATSEVWELITGATPERAKFLSSQEVVYSSKEELYKGLSLGEEEKNRINKFPTDTFVPYLFIKMDIIRENITSHISFEYDMKNKKGYNFVYEI